MQGTEYLGQGPDGEPVYREAAEGMENDMVAPSIDPNLPEGDPPRQTPNPSGAGTPPTGPIGSSTGQPFGATDDGATDDGAGDDTSDEGGPSGDVPEPGSDPDFKISREQFNERVARAKKAAREEEKKRLKEIFGTDDPEEIKRIKEEHQRLKTETEKQKRERMSREQRLQEDLKREQKVKEELEQRIQKMERDAAFAQQDSAIRGLAAKHIAQDYVDDVMFIYARTVLANMDQAEADKVTEKDIAKWFADYAKKRPAFAREQGGNGTPAKKKPISTGKPPAGKPKPTGGSESHQGKTPAPGKPNSMTKEELAKYKKERGIQW